MTEVFEQQLAAIVSEYEEALARGAMLAQNIRMRLMFLAVLKSTI